MRRAVVHLRPAWPLAAVGGGNGAILSASCIDTVLVVGTKKKTRWLIICSVLVCKNEKCRNFLAPTTFACRCNRLQQLAIRTFEKPSG